MGASVLISRLAWAGVRLSLLGPDKLRAEPQEALTDDLRQLIREHKAELIRALAPIGSGSELRLQRALANLAAEPTKQRVAIFDTDSKRGVVICTVAVRDVGTCELHIPADQYDPWTILAALESTQ